MHFMAPRLGVCRVDLLFLDVLQERTPVGTILLRSVRVEPFRDTSILAKRVECMRCVFSGIANTRVDSYESPFTCHNLRSRFLADSLGFGSHPVDVISPLDSVVVQS